jgi:hypothetical protein
MKRPGDYAKLTKISAALPLLESGAESSNAEGDVEVDNVEG